MAERSVSFEISAKVADAVKGFEQVKDALKGMAVTEKSVAADLEATDDSFRRLKDSASALAGSVAELKELSKVVQSLANLQEKASQTADAMTGVSAAISAGKVAQQEAAQAAASAATEYSTLRKSLAALQTEQADIAARQKQLNATLGVASQVREAEERIESYEAALEQLAVASQKAARTQAELKARMEQLKSVKTKDLSAQELSNLQKTQEGVKQQLRSVKSSLTSFGAATTDITNKLANTRKSFDQIGESARKRGVDMRELLTSTEALESELAALSARSNQTAAALLPVQGALKGARVAVSETARKLAESNTALAAAQTRYAALGAASRRLSDEMAPLSGRLQTAGIATQDLAQSQGKLTAELSKAKAALTETNQAVGAYVQSKMRAAQAEDDWRERGRTALSFVQRVRSEILSLVSAYIGLYAAVTQVQQAFQAGAQIQGARNTLFAANNNDISAANDELEYLSQLADATGQRFLTLTEQYAKMRAAAKNSNVTLNSQRLIFEALAEAGSVMRVSAEGMEGAFTAVTQIFSKGKIQAEELRGQLGDRLPVAVGLLAKGLGVTEAKLNDMMEAGELTSASLIALGLAAKTEFGAALAKSLQEPEAQFNLLLNVVDRLRVAFRDAAAEEGLGKALQDINEAISSKEMQEGVQALARGFVALVEAIPEVIELARALKPLLIALVPAFALKLLMSFAAGMKGLAIATRGAEGAVKAFKLTAFGWVSVIFLVIEAVKFAYDEFESFRETIDKLGEVATEVWRWIKDSTVEALDAMKAGLQEAKVFTTKFEGSWDKLLISIQQGFIKAEIYIKKFESGVKTAWNAVASAYATLYDAVGMDALADGIRKNLVVFDDTEARIDSLNKKLAELDLKGGVIDEETKREIESILSGDITGGTAKKEFTGASQIASAAELELAQLNSTAKAAAEKAAKERTKLASTLKDDILRIEKEIIEARADLTGDEQKKLELRQQEIAASFEPLMQKLRAVGDTKAIARLEELIRLQQQVEAQNTASRIGKGEKKLVDAQLKEAEKQAKAISRLYKGLRDDILNVERDILAAQGELAGTPAFALANQLESIRAEYAKLLEDLRVVTAKGTAEQRKGAQAAIGKVEELIKLEQTKASIDTSIDRSKSDEEEVNRLIERRDRQIELINVKRENGLLTSLEAEKQILAVQNEYVDKIEQAAQLARDGAKAVTESSAATEDQKRAAEALADEMQHILGITEKQNYELFKGARINEDLAGGMADGLLEVGTQLGKVIDGTNDWADAWVNVRDVMRSFFADLLANWAKALADNAMLELLGGGDQKGGGVGGAIAGVLNGVAGGQSPAVAQPEGQQPEETGMAMFGDWFSGLGDTITGAWDDFSGIFTSKTDQNTQATEKGASSIISGLLGALISGFQSIVAAIFTSSAAEGASSAAGSAAGAAVAHRGMRVGAPYGTTRSMSAAMLASAQRYHQGGVVGLKRDEVPAILQKGEMVLNRSDTRSYLGGSAPSQPQNIKIVNTFDTGTVLSEGLSTPAGGKAFINYVRANKTTIKSILN